MHRGFASSDAAETAFYQAFEHLDSALMGEVWCDTPQVLCVHPGGELLQGRDAVLRSWAEIFAHAKPPSIRVRPLQRLERPGIAVHTVEELIKPDGDSRTQSTRVIATNIYLEQEGSWCLIEHHASMPPTEFNGRGDPSKLH